MLLKCWVVFVALTASCLAQAAPAEADTRPAENSGKATRTVTRDGIELTLSLEKTVFKQGEDILIKGRLKNVAGKELHWYRTNRHDLRFVEVGSGDIWVTFASRLPLPPGAPPARHAFKAGEVVEFTVRLGGKEKVVRLEEKLENARTGLAPGRYRLEYSTTFLDHYPGSGLPVYEGKLKIEPLTIEIQAEGSR